MYHHETDPHYARTQMKKHKELCRLRRLGLLPDPVAELEKELEAERIKARDKVDTHEVETTCIYCPEPMKIKSYCLKAALKRGNGPCCKQCKHDKHRRIKG